MNPQLLPVAMEEMVAEMRRELKLRIKVYPREIATHRLNRQTAERRIEIVEAIIDLLENQQ